MQSIVENFVLDFTCFIQIFLVYGYKIHKNEFLYGTVCNLYIHLRGKMLKLVIKLIKITE